MAITNLRIHMGFDTIKIVPSVCNFTPSVIIHCQIPFQIFKFVILMQLNLLVVNFTFLENAFELREQLLSC